MATPQNVLDYLHNATCLPADGQVYRQGDVSMRHRPASKMHCEAVLVSRYNKLFRRRLVRGRWQAVEEISGRIED